ncbi:MAG: hypothetical protein HQM14_09640 [SAR324 cluster bacterium]|nr:hypothetical protein [SAR324 cluster bacterium]
MELLKRLFIFGIIVIFAVTCSSDDEDIVVDCEDETAECSTEAAESGGMGIGSIAAVAGGVVVVGAAAGSGSSGGGGGSSSSSSDGGTTTTITTTEKFSLVVSKSGSGSINSTPSGISCGSECSQDFNKGTSIILTANPSGSYDFNGWAGDCSGTGSCSVTMNSNKSVSAVFAIPTEAPTNTFTLTVGKSGRGIITSTPSGIQCGVDCSESYEEGTSVLLTVNSASDSRFAGWAGNCSGIGTCTVTMNSNKSVSAVFQVTTTTTTTLPANSPPANSPSTTTTTLPVNSLPTNNAPPTSGRSF